MVRMLLIATVLVAIAAGASMLVSSRTTEESAGSTAPSPRSRAAARRFEDAPVRAPAGAERSDLEHRIRALETKLEQATIERQRLERRLDALTAELAAAHREAREDEIAPAVAQAPETMPEASAEHPAAAAPIDYTKSPQERALIAAGLDGEAAADIKRRDDELTMATIYLRDQATREQWVDTPRFREEMAAIEGERTSIREEIGDEAYDHYLYALGQTNRVRVDEVIAESPAAQAGLQAGDMILRYGDTRLFNPGELVEQTHGGTAGEMVPLEVIRNGARLEVQVPRGPLGLKTAPTQDKPPTG